MNTTDDLETASTAIRNQLFIGAVNVIEFAVVTRDKAAFDCVIALRTTIAPFAVFTPISSCHFVPQPAQHPRTAVQVPSTLSARFLHKFVSAQRFGLSEDSLHREHGR